MTLGTKYGTGPTVVIFAQSEKCSDFKEKGWLGNLDSNQD